MEKVTIKIPKSLYEKLKTITGDSGYSSVTEFVVHVLRDLVSSDAIAQTKEPEQLPELTEEEVAAIRRRLRNLGYLD
ncbi:MAG: ribbon-helix-helix domain-containing protein [Synergistales bacterium]|nr:ribbon-helix-helix domain-containing protein [Synergistales bacterium]